VGALSPWATFNVNRKPGSPFLPVTEFMIHRRARAPAARTAAAPEPVMRYAKPGERPPSRFPRGGDDVIERFDAYARRRKG